MSAAASIGALILGTTIVGSAAGIGYLAITTSGPFAASGRESQATSIPSESQEPPIVREVSVGTIDLTPPPGVGQIGANAVAVDKAGNVYIADFDGRRIFVKPVGRAVQLLAGSGNEGSVDGPALQAEFMGPAGIAVDSAGSVFISDAPAHRIRRIDPLGTVTTIAGGGPVGLGQGELVDGRGTDARFNLPAQIAFDGAGNLLVADKDNAAIRRITPRGEVSTIIGPAGPKTAEGETVRGPVALAVATDGSVYFTDHRANGVFRLTAGGALLTLTSSIPVPITGKTTAPGAPQLSFPSGVVVLPDGTILVSDTQANRILRLSPSGVLVQVIGDASPGSSDGVGPTARFRAPTQLVNHMNGDVLLVDSGNGVLRSLTGLAP